MKKLITILLCIVMCVTTLSVLTACSTADYTIGIAQFGNFEALNNATEGFKDTLTQWATEQGKTIAFDQNNANGEQNNVSTIINTLKAKRPNLIFANATPCAVQAANAFKNSGIDMLYTSVTDPKAEGLTAIDNVYGTSDINPVEQQIQLIKEMLPQADKIAILYCSSETNSKIQADMAKQTAQQIGIEVVEITVAESNAITTTLNTRLTDDIDAVYIPTDNMISNNIGTVADICNTKNIPTVVGEIGMVTGGGTATFSIDYYQLGVQTAEIAIKLLQGETVPDNEKHQTYTKQLAFSINEQSALQCGISQQTIDELKAKYGN